MSHRLSPVHSVVPATLVEEEAPMPEGPVEYLLVTFPDGQFRGELVASLVDLVDTETIRILDLVVIAKANDGTVTSLEIDDLDDNHRDLFSDLCGEYGGLPSAEEIAFAAEGLDSGQLAVARCLGLHLGGPVRGRAPGCRRRSLGRRAGARRERGRIHRRIDDA